MAPAAQSSSLTASQRNTFEMLREAIDAAPEHLRAKWLYSLCADSLSGGDLERLGDKLGRAGHFKSRTPMQEWGSMEIAAYVKGVR